MPSILPCGWSLHCSPIRVWTDTCVDTQWAGRAQRAGVCHLLGSRRVKPSTALYRLPTTQETKPQHFCLQLSQYIYIYIYPTSPSVPSIYTPQAPQSPAFRQTLSLRKKTLDSWQWEGRKRNILTKQKKNLKVLHLSQESCRELCLMLLVTWRDAEPLAVSMETYSAFIFFSIVCLFFRFVFVSPPTVPHDLCSVPTCVPWESEQYA